MSHFRRSFPKRYRFQCSLNLNAFSTIFGWNKCYWRVEGSSLEFLFLLVGLVPLLLMFHQIINVKCNSALAWVPGAGMPCWCSGSSSCPHSEMQLNKGCVGWPVPLAQREGPEAEGLTSSGRAAYVLCLAGDCLDQVGTFCKESGHASSHQSAKITKLRIVPLLSRGQILQVLPDLPIAWGSAGSQSEQEAG